MTKLQRREPQKLSQQSNKSNFSKVHWSSVSYNWDTPLAIFNELNKEFHFNLDPTDRPIGGLPGLKDGLRMPYGTKENPAILYNNPPYGRGLIDQYVQWTGLQMRRRFCETAVFLVPLRNSDYFKRLRKYGAEFRLCEKRLKFGDADKSSKTSGSHGAPFDSVVAIFQAQVVCSL